MSSTATYTPKDHSRMMAMSADEHRAAARRHAGQAADSFDRCDTDGFLSQWADGQMRLFHLAWAQLVEEGGTVDTWALFDLQGNLVSVNHGWSEGRYGSREYYRLGDGTFFNPSQAKKPARRNAANRAKGFTVGSVRVGATVANHAILPRKELLLAGDFTIVSTDDDTADYTL